MRVMKQNTFRLLLFAALSVLSLAMFASAQTETARIQGTVTDATGAIDDYPYVFGRVFEQDASMRNRTHSYAVVAFNVSSKEKEITLPNSAIGRSEKLIPVLSDANRHRSYPGQPDGKVTINEKRELILRLPAKSVAIYSTDRMIVTEN